MSNCPASGAMGPRVKMLIRSIEMAQARELAAFALDSDSPKEILTRAEALAKAAAGEHEKAKETVQKLERE